MKVSVIGLGKLGSPMAACFAAKGHQVIGADLNEHYVRLINQGVAPVLEPGLDLLGNLQIALHHNAITHLQDQQGKHQQSTVEMEVQRENLRRAVRCIPGPLPAGNEDKSKRNQQQHPSTRRQLFKDCPKILARDGKSMFPARHAL